MNSISVSPLVTPRPVTLAGPGYQTAKAGVVAAPPQSVATAPAQDERPAARRQAPEPTRAQGAEQRLRKNRPEEGSFQIGAAVAEVELKFGDFLDLINPLQHIPIVSTIYRAITGDEIGAPAKILGGLLFGGPIGSIAAIFDTIVTQATGRDLGETVMAAFIDRDAAPAAQVADARDIQGRSAQDGAFEASPSEAGASEAGPATASGPPAPVSGHSDPFGLERGAAAPIVAAPVAVTPVPVTQSPQAATVPGSGLGEKPLVPAAQGPDVSPVPVAAGAPVVAVELISAGAPKPGNPRLVPSIATTDRGFAERMLEALDKYQAQASGRYSDNQREIRRLDLDL